ncbi:MAG TPA: VOC family protein [Ktedonobacteraceae bacterium]
MSQSWPLKRVGLRVRDLEKTLAYYQRLGLAIVRDQRAEGIIGLGAGELELLTLRHTPDAPVRKPHTAGLYHFAILLPGETDLASFLNHSVKGAGVRIDGASDHLVSQALYLNDPEGNGIEVYADRPREKWSHSPDGQIVMDTVRLRANELLAKAQDFHGFPTGTILGHMHLNVSNLDESLAFYEQTFGLNLVNKLYNQAGFVSWDGYHHHLALNTWTGPNATRHEPGVSGIEFFEFSRPGLQAGTYEDPNGVKVVVGENK